MGDECGVSDKSSGVPRSESKVRNFSLLVLVVFWTVSFIIYWCLNSFGFDLPELGGGEEGKCGIGRKIRICTEKIENAGS